MKYMGNSRVTSMKIKKILVPLDGSKSSLEALSEAVYLARQCGSTITGLHVIPIYPRHLGELVTPLKITLFKEAEKIMGKAKTICAQNGIVFRSRIEYGDAKFEINHLVKKGKFDLVVIGSRGLSPIKEMLLGSVSNSVVHRCRIPVLVTK